MDNKILNSEMKNYISLVSERISGKNLFYNVITFGCQQNQADSEKISAMAEDMGYLPTDKLEDASLIIINTCAIREHAEVKANSLIGKFREIKAKNPELVVGVVGCMAAEPHKAEYLKKKFEYVSFTLEPSLLHKIPEAIYKFMAENERSVIYGTDFTEIVEGVEPIRNSSHRAWVSVMYGCNNFCSYCIVPYVRGRERSRKSADIIAECKALIDRGYKEITLLGQNVNSYKSDMTFPELVKTIADIPGDFILRFMTSHPKDASPELIRVMGEKSDKIAPHFHLPLQSGSDRILKLMNRTYDTERFIGIVNALREAVPEIAISTDIIVGFPGESEEDFLKTLEMLEKVRFDLVFAFMYSKREGTRAAKMEGHLPEDVKSERLARLFAMQDKISLEKNQPYLSKTVKVLVDSAQEKDGKTVYTARTLSNKPVHFESKENCVGKFKKLKITVASAFVLNGEETEDN